MLSNTLRLNFCYLKIIHILHHVIIQKTVHILKHKQSVCIHEIIRLIMMIMKIKMKNRSRRYDKNRPRPRHGHKCSKYKKCLCTMMFISQQTFVLMKTSFVFVFIRRLQDVFKTSWLRSIYLSWPYVFKSFSRRPQDVL